MVKNGCQMFMSWTQYHLNGWSYQFLGHCHHLDVAIQLQWLRNECLSMVEEEAVGLSWVICGL